MPNPQLQKIGAAELTDLQQIARQTFIETFAAHNSAANMADYVDRQLSAAQLQHELQQAGSSFYLLRVHGQVAGYMKLNTATAQTHPEALDALEIERIYVLEAFQGQKIGRFLLQKALEEARQMRAPYVWLGVWEANLKAIRFYEQHGFEQYATHVFQLGSDAQTDWLMKLALDYC